MKKFILHLSSLSFYRPYILQDFTLKYIYHDSCHSLGYFLCTFLLFFIGVIYNPAPNHKRKGLIFKSLSTVKISKMKKKYLCTLIKYSLSIQFWQIH